jgi:UTP--glucose-1-phosphate uridylyltransferase
MPITKAVIACGGWSTRFLPTVKTYAKQLVPILDRPQIHWVLESLIGAGITEVCIIHRDGETSLTNHFSPDAQLDSYLTQTNKTSFMAGWQNIVDSLKLTFLPQTTDFPYGNGSPVLVAKNFIDNQPFVYLYGDDLIIEDTPGNLIKDMVQDFEKHNAGAMVAVQEVPNSEIHRYGCIKYMPGSTDQIEKIIEKPQNDLAPSNIAQGGPFVLSPQIVQSLELSPTQRGELWLIDGINHLINSAPAFTTSITQKGAVWVTTGDPTNWFRANILLAKNHPDFSPALTP